MIPRLIKTTQLDIEQTTFSVCFYETRTLRGNSRYSAEVVFHPEDHMILDADSVKGLEAKLASLVHASLYGRVLVGTETDATGAMRRRGARPETALRARYSAAAAYGVSSRPTTGRPRRGRTTTTAAGQRP